MCRNVRGWVTRWSYKLRLCNVDRREATDLLRQTPDVGKTQQKSRNRHKKLGKCISRSGLAEFGVPKNRAANLSTGPFRNEFHAPFLFNEPDAVQRKKILSTEDA